MIFFILFLPLKTFAKEDSSDFGLSELYEIIPPEVLELVKSVDSNVSAEELDKFLNAGNLLKASLNCCKKAVLTNKENYLCFLFISVALFLYRAISGSMNERLSGIANIAVITVSGLSVYTVLESVVKSFSESFLHVSGFISSVASVALASMSASGSGASAVAFGSICSVLISVFNFVCCYVLIPYVNISLALIFSGGITSDSNLLKISSFSKKVCFGVIGSVLSLFFGLMSVQSVIAMGNDSLVKRTMRQVLNNSLPIFGGMLSEGVDTLFIAAVGVKNSAGILGIVSTVLISLYPIAELTVCFLFITVICYLLSFFEGNPILDFLSGARDVLSVIICVALALTVMTLLLFYFILKVT